MRKPSSHLQSICLPQTDQDLVHPIKVDPSIRESLTQTYHEKLLECSPQHTWAGDSYLRSVPYPILVTDRHLQHLEDLSDALFLAIADIVERWWTDTEARFPQRMPLEPVEEELLRWLNGQTPDIVRPFRTCAGSWRPDFLLETSSDDPDGMENYRICEINSRFSWNGFFFTAYGHQALDNMGIDRYGLQGAADPQKILNGLGGLYDANLPLHLVKGEEHGYDIHLFTSYAELTLGFRPRIIHPSDLRLVPSPGSVGGYKLFCLAKPEPQTTVITVAGETLEEIHQLGLELHQRELLAMSYPLLQQLSLRCFNDMRTILLVHDKRMLGLVREELDALVARSVLTPRQARLLDLGLVPTINPGSKQLDELIDRSAQDETLKDRYLLKPVRSGKGAGILFGDEIGHSEWTSILQRMREPGLSSGAPTYVVQRKIEQMTYEVLGQDDQVKRYPLIGTFHVVHGSFLGLGLWRSGPGRICALSRGGGWMCSVRLIDSL